MRWQWIQNLCWYFGASILIRPPYALPSPSPLSAGDHGATTRRLAEAKQLVRDCLLHLALNMKQFDKDFKP
jgi:hypothetical protein